MTGVGPTESAARAHARSLALDEVIGQLVDAESSLSGEELRSEVIAVRAGYVEQFVALESGLRADGQYQVRARVLVRSNLGRGR